MEIMRKNNEKIIATIKKDAKNQPFVTVDYDFGNGLHKASDLSAEEIKKASGIFHKFIFNDNGVVKYNSETNTFFSDNDININNTPAFVTGSEIGKTNCITTIVGLSEAASNLDNMIPFYVTDGKKVIYYNENSLDFCESLMAGKVNQLSKEEIKNREIEKGNLFSNMIS